MFQDSDSYNQYVDLSFSNGVRVWMKREDLLHSEISGNKFRKLKYNFARARSEKAQTLLTFGGAYSNHIAATAAAGRIAGIQTVGVIRGEELETKFLKNPTLRKAHEDGMKLYFVSRSEYRKKNDPFFLNQLKYLFGDFYLVPEGGTNALAVKGCEEIVKKEDLHYDYICVAVGTGGTISGVVNASDDENQQILGFPVLKGDFLSKDIRKFVRKNNWQLLTEYHFGGYGKYSNELLAFIADFESRTSIPLDPIYTGKMMFGICDLIKKGFFKQDSTILAIHTGGLQGWNDTIRIKPSL